MTDVDKRFNSKHEVLEHLKRNRVKIKKEAQEALRKMKSPQNLSKASKN